MARQVVFYEYQNIDDEDDFDRTAALREINDLDDDDWLVEDANSNLGVIVDKVGTASKPSRLRFLRIRPDAPYKLSAARELSLVEVNDDEAISEFTYVVLWPDGFMAAVSSREAPAHKKLGRYFRETSGEEVRIVNLFVPDVVERLKELVRNGLRNVKVKVQTSNAMQIKADDRVPGFRQFFNAGREAEAATITVELGVGRPKGRRLSEEIGAEVEELAEMGDLLETMIVRGTNDDGKVRSINMKEERITGPIEITADMDDKAVYAAIAKIRREVEKDTGPLDEAARGS
jgi:hypothetical protein